MTFSNFNKTTCEITKEKIEYEIQRAKKGPGNIYSILQAVETLSFEDSEKEACENYLEQIADILKNRKKDQSITIGDISLILGASRRMKERAARR